MAKQMSISIPVLTPYYNPIFMVGIQKLKNHWKILTILLGFPKREDFKWTQTVEKYPQKITLQKIKSAIINEDRGGNSYEAINT